MRKFYNGFTLIEAVVALFVFLIIMLSLSNTFTQSFAGYRNTRAVQKDVENAQFALNLMAKELRTSTVVSSGGTKKIVKFYDHSQSICFEYKIIDDVNDKLTVSKKNIDTGNTSYYDDPDDPSTFNPFLACAGSSGFSSATDLIRIENTGGKLEGNFAVVPSDKNSSPKKLGKITISLQISEGPKHTANVQTTSSLRDFGYVEVAP